MVETDETAVPGRGEEKPSAAENFDDQKKRKRNLDFGQVLDFK